MVPSMSTIVYNPENQNKTVIVGMSGGVDSSVTALILKKQGYKVIGLFMKNWEEQDEFGVCQSSKEYKDVISVCEKLDIPYYSIDFVEEYRANVFQHFLDEYELGHTPNPDILCNREIKFKVFFDKAMELGADYLATGHYCRNLLIDGVHHLGKGVDPKKDQSYFLYAINPKVLDKVLFPVGELEKSEVRKLAHEFDLSTKDKKDSTGICFIGERNFKNFLSQYLQAKTGLFKTLDGTVVGEHSGSSYYTIGQRKGLGLGGQGEPWFVVDKDHEQNVVYVERGEEHPSLYADELWANELTWLNYTPKINEWVSATCKIRYRQNDQACEFMVLETGEVHVRFPVPQRAITIRQSVVFYHGDVCLGGGMISRRGKTHFEQGKLSMGFINQGSEFQEESSPSNI